MATKLTKHQLEEITAAFEVFDKDGDGHVSTEEVEDVLKGRGLSHKQVQAMVFEVDRDHNGSIELEEFIAMMTKYINEGPAETEMRAQFKRFDKDHNGRIDAMELMGTMREQGIPITHDDAMGMISMADRDGDGYIDYNEFKKLMMELARDEFPE